MIRPKPTQGPDWLYEFLFDPPFVVEVGVYLTAIAVVGVAYLGYRRSGFDEDVIEDMAFNMFVVIAAWGLTAGLVTWGTFPYLADVVIGGVGGFAIAKGGYLAVQRWTAG